MKKTFCSTYTFILMISTPVLIIMFMCMSCSKTEEPLPIPYTPPVLSPPSGVIDNFVITDSLVPFNMYGATLKWLVTGTNAQTVITLNGVKISYYGILDTGPLKQTTTFTLAINNGKKADVVLNVADSITTNMWNKGKRLKIIKSAVYIVVPNTTLMDWVDTTIDDHTADQRIYFNFRGTSQIAYKTASSNIPTDGGPFVVHIGTNGSDSYFTWQGNTYIIIDLDGNFLEVTFDAPQPNGTKLKTRNTYQFE